MKTRKIFLRLVFLLLFNNYALVAQKLPSKQEKSLQAPRQFVIDGNIVEWNTLQAFNKSTMISYTMANNKEDLFLVVKVTEPAIIKKIFLGGLTLTVNKFEKKDNDKGQSITFPLFSGENSHAILSSVKKLKDERDTNTKVINQWLVQMASVIKITGISNVKDTLSDLSFSKLPMYSLPGQYLGVNNPDEIRAASQIDKEFNYTIELKVPLQKMGIASGSKFYYNVRLNGPMYKNGIPAPGVVITTRYVNGEAIHDNQDLINFTDFWAEYSLQ
jgi:hypothetical protein